MLRSLLSFDWKKSPAHLLFLSKFINPRTINDFSNSIAWKEVLGETPQKAIKRFIDHAMLVQGGLADSMAYRFKVSDLKQFAKQRGLSTAGKKAELIDNLIQADGEGMLKAVGKVSVLKCSDEGCQIAEQYVNQEKQKRLDVENKVYTALKERNFKEASKLVATYEAAQVFSRGIGIDWKNYNVHGDVKMLEVLFAAKPKFSQQLESQQLEFIRLATGMIMLWGTNSHDASKWLPENFQTSLNIGSIWLVNMLHSHVYFKSNITAYKESGAVKEVQTTTANDSFVCGACAKLAKRRFKLDEIPELPYEHCTSETGCRCGIRPII